MSLRRLIDAAVRCTLCGKPPGCRCRVTLRCRCGARQDVPRTKSDGDVDVIMTTCPTCQEREASR